MLALGERRLREQFTPTYTEMVLAQLPTKEREAFLLRLAANQRADRPSRRLRPSEIFPAISPGLDARLARDGRDIDIACLEALAALPVREQGTFYDRYVQDPEAARQWAQMPTWKRPIMGADAQDRLIWQIFVVLRLKTEWCAKYSEGLASEGYKLVQLAGLLGSLKGDGPQRLGLVLAGYGSYLREGRDPGENTRPPWPVDYTP